jgi:hypothetical protein
MNNVAMNKISILGDHNLIILISQAGYFGIGGSIALGQIQGMDGIVPQFSQPNRQGPRKLGINQKPHDAAAWRPWPKHNRAA